MKYNDMMSKSSDNRMMHKSTDGTNARTHARQVKSSDIHPTFWNNHPMKAVNRQAQPRLKDFGESLSYCKVDCINRKLLRDIP